MKKYLNTLIFKDGQIQTIIFNSLEEYKNHHKMMLRYIAEEISLVEFEPAEGSTIRFMRSHRD